MSELTVRSSVTSLSVCLNCIHACPTSCLCPHPHPHSPIVRWRNSQMVGLCLYANWLKNCEGRFSLLKTNTCVMEIWGQTLQDTIVYYFFLENVFHDWLDYKTAAPSINSVTSVSTEFEAADHSLVIILTLVAFSFPFSHHGWHPLSDCVGKLRDWTKGWAW